MSRLQVLIAVALPLGGAVHAEESWRAVRDEVDATIARRWTEDGAVPAGQAAEAALLRRTYLDLTGVIPTVGETRAYLADADPAKHEKLVDRLIGNADAGRPPNPRHATHMANRWRETMLNVTDNRLVAARSATFENWLRQRFVENTPYDQLARELLTATGNVNQTGPVLYYTSLEMKPEKLAASTARIFLGLQIECAQCHDHPFDVWRQRDFWGYAAFFARLQQASSPQQQRFLFQVSDVAEGDVVLPDTEEVVPPRFPGTSEPLGEEPENRRAGLAEWVTAPENPYFARAAVNRMWATLFGYGLVDPVDDFGSHNPPSHPAVLDLLARDFVEHGYDVQRTLRILANTRTYALSSEPTDAEIDPRLFASMPVKSLTGEQVYDTLQRATLNRGTTMVNGRVVAPQFNRQRTAFLAKFQAPSQSATEFEGGIPQALTMMNGDVVAELTDATNGELVTAVSESPFLDDGAGIEVLFLATLVRFPESHERERFVAHLERASTPEERRAAFSDVLWALLNSTEFLLNH